MGRNLCITRANGRRKRVVVHVQLRDKQVQPHAGHLIQKVPPCELIDPTQARGRVGELATKVALYAERIDGHAALLHAFQQPEHGGAVALVIGRPTHEVVVHELPVRCGSPRSAERDVDRSLAP